MSRVRDRDDDCVSAPGYRNGVAAKLAGLLVRSFELLGIRGAPTLFRAMSRASSIRRISATTRIGNRIIGFPAFDEYWCRYLWAEVPYETDIAHIFSRLGRGAVLIDGGANIGYWSVRSADFGFTQVIAVEPNENIIPYLKKNLRQNQVNGEVIRAAIHSRSGETLLLKIGLAHAESRLGDQGVPVPTVTIADLLENIPSDQEIIAKLDVEGAEIAAIDGAGAVEKIVFVYEDFRMFGMSTTRQLLQRGMVLIGVDGEGRHCRIRTMDEAFAFRGPDHVGGINIIAVHPERADEIEARLSGV